MPSAYERRQEAARRQGYSSYYWLRQARTQEKAAEEALDIKLRNALQYRREYGMSIQRAAREAKIAPERLASVERAYGVPARGAIGERGKITMQSIQKGEGTKFIVVNDHNASLNGSYLNYVRWAFYEPVAVGSRIAERRDTVDEDEIYKAQGRIGDSIQVEAVYGSHKEAGIIMPDDYPESDYGEDGGDFYLEYDIEDLEEYVDDTDAANPNAYTKK